MRRILIAPRPLYVHIDLWPIAAVLIGAGQPSATSWPVLDGMPPRSRGKGATSLYARSIMSQECRVRSPCMVHYVYYVY
eukprot:COSAG01_NODE_1978_length_8747_cov_87.182007_10_plen_79_part_00